MPQHDEHDDLSALDFSSHQSGSDDGHDESDALDFSAADDSGEESDVAALYDYAPTETEEIDTELEAIAAATEAAEDAREDEESGPQFTVTNPPETVSVYSTHRWQDSAGQAVGDCDQAHRIRTRRRDPGPRRTGPEKRAGRPAHLPDGKCISDRRAGRPGRNRSRQQPTPPRLDGVWHAIADAGTGRRGTDRSLRCPIHPR